MQLWPRSILLWSLIEPLYNKNPNLSAPEVDTATCSLMVVIISLRAAYLLSYFSSEKDSLKSEYSRVYYKASTLTKYYSPEILPESGWVNHIRVDNWSVRSWAGSLIGLKFT